MLRWRSTRLFVLAVPAVLAALLVSACHLPPAPEPTVPSSGGSRRVVTDPAKAEAVRAVVEQTRSSAHLRAVIVSVTDRDGEISTAAYGESMTGVPATTDMHFRNGAVAISYVSTLLLLLVEKGQLSLDDKVSQYLPDLRYADQVTVGQLAQMTSGYADYVADPEMSDAQYAQPLRHWKPEELIAYATRRPLVYRPGTNWNYSHTNYVILGLVLEEATGRSVRDLLQEYVLDPLELRDTTDPGTPAIPDPALHAFTSERREFLKLKPGEPFTEESTYWNPSWTITHGAIQTTTIQDLNATARGIGSGALLQPESYRQLVSRDLIGRTTAIKGCSTCFEQSVGYSYGLGIVNSGNWVLQNPLFSGAAGAFGYHPASDTAIAVAVTFEPAAFDPATGAYANAADQLWRLIGEQLVPDDPPPIKR